MGIKANFSGGSNFKVRLKPESTIVEVNSKSAVFIHSEDGEDGAVFYPHVSPDANLSWTNNKGLENPPTINIRGPQGIQGVPGNDGYTPIKGKDYFDGKNGADGKDGEDGISVTHSWDGAILTITSASGTSSVNLKGEKGDKGDKGEPGLPGVTGKDGVNGKDGKDGVDGRTPIKGTDYFTETDKAEMVSAVLAALPVYDGEVV